MVQNVAFHVGRQVMELNFRWNASAKSKTNNVSGCRQFSIYLIFTKILNIELLCNYNVLGVSVICNISKRKKVFDISLVQNMTKNYHRRKENPLCIHEMSNEFVGVLIEVG